MNERRRIAVLTTGRQDWGLLEPLCEQLQKRQDIFELQLLGGGMALSHAHGNTIDTEIRAHGFEPAACLEWDVDNSPPFIQAAAATEAVGKALKSLAPEALVLLGDRFETAAAALAATLQQVPIIHLFGGEETEGAFDNALRHAITKMSHLHFVSHPLYAKRVLQMGEDPQNVHTVGSLAVDNVAKTIASQETADDKNQSLLAIGDDLGVILNRPLVLVTLHPTTLADEKKQKAEIDTAIEAMESFPATYIVTLPNADPANAIIRKSFLELSDRKDNIHCFSALGKNRYLRLLNLSDLVFGNSSSGMTEAPMLKIPTVNVGDRQKGRIRFPSIIDVEPTATSIVQAFERAISSEHKKKCEEMTAPFGDAAVATRVADVLSDWHPPTPSRKTFIDR